MRKIMLTLWANLVLLLVFGQQNSTPVPTISVDAEGVMRWSDTHEEASFFGVNYTVPFSHGYRALQYKSIDVKDAIDRDVYHLKRLGFNAYRVHIWDVEISDSVGNVLNNEHLEVLDYLFHQLEQHDMRILITTMTTFGNGYPERNVPTGGFSYLYDKCQVHTDPKAIEAQKNYVSQLLQHTNPHNGYQYKDDPYIVGFEVNNEPCHASTVQQTAQYIKSMVDTMRATGLKKPIFYNVSHNMDHVPAYFGSDIQGTTYQWYPIGLVSGQQRFGNFLPHVDRYGIPFDTVQGFSNKAKLIYEYDPADNLYGYLHPAIVRTFRSSGFQWITQFAYDAIDLAAYNTEYQTHYLNLAYTPAKAVSMLIAGEVATKVRRNADYGVYPQDTIFGDFMVSYKQDLALLNAREKYYFTNNTSVAPLENKTLKHIAGVRNSAITSYEGSGAYFLDKLSNGVWRLEVMPDVEMLEDPFAKPTLSREIADIYWNSHAFSIILDDLGRDFVWQSLSDESSFSGKASEGKFQVKPGVYLLIRNGVKRHIATKFTKNTPWNGYTLGHYVAPKPSQLEEKPVVIHRPSLMTTTNKDLDIALKTIASLPIDSVYIQTNRVSFWSDINPYYKLSTKDGVNFVGKIPHEAYQQGQEMSYTATVFLGDKSYTYPDGKEGTPLTWDALIDRYWTVSIVEPYSVIYLFSNEDGIGFENFAIPSSSYMVQTKVREAPEEANKTQYKLVQKDSLSRFFFQKDVKEILHSRLAVLDSVSHLCIEIGGLGVQDCIQAGFVTDIGYTYVAPVQMTSRDNAVVRIPLAALQQTKTVIVPEPYPDFLKRYFEPKTSVDFDLKTVEKFVIQSESGISNEATLTFGNMWLEF